MSRHLLHEADQSTAERFCCLFREVREKGRVFAAFPTQTGPEKMTRERLRPQWKNLMRDRTGPCRLEEAFRQELFRLINKYLSFPEDATPGAILRTLASAITQNRPIVIS